MSLNMNPSERRCPIVLIPSLEPETALITYVERLRQQGFEHIIIIDDGSGEDYRHIFSALEQGGATLLVHERNQGKGAAIKTGLRWIKEHAPQSFSIITVDSDGQHTVPDVVNMARAAAENPEALVLGQRDFSSTETPWKSSFGNKVATVAFAVLHHVHLADTQTGLRAFGQELLDDMLTLPGNGFEYKTQMLVMAVKRQVPMVPVAISTVYENDNGGTHFHPVRDSISVIKALVGTLFSFSLSSLVCAGVDLGLAWALFAVPLVGLPMHGYTHILVATGLARVISIALNFLINRTLIFRHQASVWPSLVKYLALSATLIVLSSTGVYLLSLVGVAVALGKAICDCVLFFLSYRVQQSWVFASPRRSR